jgi:ketosteroid isomerase-like protein
MRQFMSLTIATFILALSVSAQSAPDAAELIRLLKDFLDGASRNDSAMHDRFWAEDLIYTGSSGRRIGKADIMRDQHSGSAPRPGAPAISYAAEDIRIQQYGTTAIVAFRLVATTKGDGRIERSSYLNTGTFLKRTGNWQVVSWQATRMPSPDEDAKRNVAATESGLNQAILAADIKKLESLMDESFVWTHDAGNKVSRRELLDQLGSGRLKYSKLETANVTIAVYGDTAIVRGVSLRQRSSIPGEASGDERLLTIYYTLTLGNKGSGWTVVGMHTSRP